MRYRGIIIFILVVGSFIPSIAFTQEQTETVHVIETTTTYEELPDETEVIEYLETTYVTDTPEVVEEPTKEELEIDLLADYEDFKIGITDRVVDLEEKMLLMDND